MICMFVVQFLGGLAGLLVTYLLAKDKLAWKLYPGLIVHDIYRINDDGEESIFFGRVCLQEFILTFLFTLVFLMMKYET